MLICFRWSAQLISKITITSKMSRIVLRNFPLGVTDEQILEQINLIKDILDDYTIFRKRLLLK